MSCTCQQLEDWLDDYVAGDLAVEHCEHVRVHVETCGRCKVMVETFRLTVTVCRKLPPREMPARLQEKLNEALKTLAREKQPPRVNNRPAPTAYPQAPHP